MAKQSITISELRNKVSVLNMANGIAYPQWNVVGSYRISEAYGGYALEKVTNEHGGVNRLTGYGTKAELYYYVKGMLLGQYERTFVEGN